MFNPILKITAQKIALLASVVLLASTLPALAVEEDAESNNLIMPHVTIKQGSDLTVDAKEARENKVPVLILFAMEHCPFCMVVEEEFLKPMLRNAEYGKKVIIRKIKIDSTTGLRDFSGKQRDAGEFSEDYNVSLVPTVVLLDADGKKLAPSIVGLANRYYYGGDLDNAIDASLLRLRAIAKR